MVDAFCIFPIPILIHTFLAFIWNSISEEC